MVDFIDLILTIWLVGWLAGSLAGMVFYTTNSTN